jgi:superfamily II DNA or RNA helicase
LNELPVHIAANLDAERVHALADALRAFPSQVRHRGEDYALAGRVMEERSEATHVAARVRGSRVYAVRWTFHEHGADPICSCPAAPLCKHSYAVGIRLLAAAREHGLALESGEERLLPAAWRGQRTEVPESLVRRPAGEPFDPRLRALREATQPWLRLAATEQLLWKLGLGPIELPAGVLDEITYEPDPDIRCWRLAHAVREVSGRMPRALAAWAAREDLATRAAESTRRHVVERLSSWASSTERQPRTLRVVLGLREGVDGHAPAVTIQARVSGPKLADEPRSTQQLSQLHSEMRRDTRLLSPPQARLLRLLTENEMYGLFDQPGAPTALDNEQLNLLLDRAAGSPFVSWSDRVPRGLAERAGITSGGRASLDGDDLKLVLECHAEGGELHLGLGLAGADGRIRPLSAALLWRPERHLATTHPTVALLEGAFHRVVEEPPADIVRMLGELHGVPLRREDGPLLDRLASRFESVADALRTLTREYAARPAMVLDLRESDWLCVRLFAHTSAMPWQPGDALEQGERLFEHSPQEGWIDAVATRAPISPDVSQALAEAPAAAAEAPASAPTPGPVAPWREAPQPALVASALAWLERLGAMRGDRRGPGGQPPEPDAGSGWWLRLNPRAAEKLEELWRERPRDVSWFGNRAAHDLLAGRRRVSAKVSVLATGIDWLDVKAEWEAEGWSLTDADLAKLRGSRDAFVRLSGGWVRRDDVASHDALAVALADLGLEADGHAARLPLWQLAGAKLESFETLASAGADEATLASIRRIRESLATFAGIPHVEPPAGLTATLRPYQRDGLDFLVWTSSIKLGAVLADDMGLGKTVQALAWLQHLRDQDPAGGPALVVCPASVAHNWAREAARFTPGLRVMVLGSGRERRAQLEDVAAYDLVVTNYALLRRDVATLREIPLRAAILDEAQNVKNPDAAVAKASLELKARHRIALTGTPLENRALDLWSILAFVQPGHLGSRRRFVERYDRADSPPHARRLLAAKLRPVMLRRLKAQVERDLPERIEERLDCSMTPGQRKLYLGELVRARALLHSAIKSPEDLARRRIIMLSVLTKLRQICCHPTLVDGDRALGSGKFDALFELLEPLRAEGQKTLVFSQFVRCLDLLADAMKRQGIPFHVLTGETSTKKREQVVRAFTEDAEPSVFLVSLKAGGTGLNLTAASHVVLFDPWWNPAVEAQAIDRTHRIGQTRSVVAYRLYAEGTIEERIAELQQRKAALARDVLGEDGFARTLTKEDLEFLLAE